MIFVKNVIKKHQFLKYFYFHNIQVSYPLHSTDLFFLQSHIYLKYDKKFVLLKIIYYLCSYMKTPCKECPHVIKNRHNDMIVEFGKRTGKKHNCHMTEGVKDLWNVKNEKLECYGSKRDNLRSL